MGAEATVVAVPAFFGNRKGAGAYPPAVVDRMPEDRELVMRCRAGEADAFLGLVSAYREPLYRMAYRFLRDHHDALDVAQEAFARAWEKLESYDPARPFATWLMSIGANLARDILRKRGRRNTFVDHDAVRDATGGRGPEAEVAGRDEAERLRRAVAELDEDKRIAVTLRYFEGRSLAEMEEITGIAANTLKVRLFRARRELQEKLEGS